MSAFAGKPTFKTINSNVRFILKADIEEVMKGSKLPIPVILMEQPDFYWIYHQRLPDKNQRRGLIISATDSNPV